MQRAAICNLHRFYFLFEPMHRRIVPRKSAIPGIQYRPGRLRTSKIWGVEDLNLRIFSPDSQYVLRNLTIAAIQNKLNIRRFSQNHCRTMRTTARHFLLCSCLGVALASTAPRRPQSSLQRGQRLSSTLPVDDLYASYLQARAEYQARLSKDNTGWRKVVKTKSNITVSLLNHPDDPYCPYVKMEMQVPVPVDDVVDFLSIPKWDANMPKVDPYYEGVTVHKSVQHKGADIAVCHRRMKRLGGLFGKRDFAFLSVTEEEGPSSTSAGGTRVATTMSIITPKIPRMSGYTRGYQDSYAIYRPVNNGKST